MKGFLKGNEPSLATYMSSQQTAPAGNPAGAVYAGENGMLVILVTE